MSQIEYNECIIHSDNGVGSLTAYIYAGLSSDNEFGVEYKFTDGNDSWNSDDIYAVLSKEDSFVVANFMKVDVSVLPQIFVEKFSPSTSDMKPSEVETLFKVILDFIHSIGVKYKLIYL